MTSHTEKEGAHTPGEMYVYTGEDKDAIAIAIHGKGPNGGWQGWEIATMPIPSKRERATREEINANAARLALAWNSYEALKSAAERAEQYLILAAHDNHSNPTLGPIAKHDLALLRSALTIARGKTK